MVNEENQLGNSVMFFFQYCGPLSDIIKKKLFMFDKTSVFFLKLGIRDRLGESVVVDEMYFWCRSNGNH